MNTDLKNKSMRHTVLCVDDEKEVLSSIKRLLRKENYELLTALSGEEGLELFKQHDIHLVISDHRMSGMSGISFLTTIKAAYPDTIRILLTGYAEIESIKESINEGNIYKFILKPWNDDNLKIEIRKSLEQYDLIQSNRSLSEALAKKNLELQQINQHLETLIKKRTRELELKNQVLELTRNIFESLPIPVLGISSDQTVVLINKQAMEIHISNQPLRIGDSIKEFFTGEIIREISPVFESKCDQITVHHKIENQLYSITLSSISGQFAKSSFILCLQKQGV